MVSLLVRQDSRKLAVGRLRLLSLGRLSVKVVGVVVCRLVGVGFLLDHRGSRHGYLAGIARRPRSRYQSMRIFVGCPRRRVLLVFYDVEGRI